MPDRNRTRDVLIGAMTVAMIVLSAAFYKDFSGSLFVSSRVGTEATNEPQKTDFGTALPTDFPTDIPIEKGVTVEESYSLDYAGQKQLTITFLSAKTVKENYALYQSFLKSQKWTISNTYASTTLSSLYGTKGSNDINVTISKNTSRTSIQSQVSISVLNK